MNDIVSGNPQGNIDSSIPTGAIVSRSKAYTSSGKLYDSHDLYDKHQFYYKGRESGAAPNSTVLTL